VLLYQLFRMRRRQLAGMYQPGLTTFYVLVMASLLAPAVLGWWTGAPRTGTVGIVGFIGCGLVMIEGFSAVVLSRRERRVARSGAPRSILQGKLDDIIPDDDKGTS
jgi:hypothetical protein